MSFLEHIQSADGVLAIWFYILGAVHVGLIPFALWDNRARVSIFGTIILAGLTTALFYRFGYTRIIALGHIVVWAFLIPWVFNRLGQHAERHWTRRYLMLYLLVIGICFIIDAADVAKYMALGDRTPYGG